MRTPAVSYYGATRGSCSLASNLRVLTLPGFYDAIFRLLAVEIARLNEDTDTDHSAIWPYLRTLDFGSRYPLNMSSNATLDSSWVIASAPVLQSVPMYSPDVAPKYLPDGLDSLMFTVQDKLSASILHSRTAAANLRTLTLNGAHSTGSYNQPPAFRSMADALLAAAPALLNLRTLNIRGFGPKNSLANATIALVALPSLRTVRLPIVGDGDVRPEAVLLTRILDAANAGLSMLGLICLTSPALRRGPLPSFVLDVYAKSRLLALRTISYAARRTEGGRLYPPLISRPNALKFKALCISRRVKFEVVELASNQVWPGDAIS